jgi:flagellar protein FliS
MSTRLTSAYRTVDATTSDPAVLTTMLFDGAITAMKKARIQLEHGNRHLFLDEISRAQMIVGELLSTLNLDHGELPRTLSGIYAYCLRALTDASLGNLARLDEAQRHISQIGDSWKSATGGLRTGTASSSLVQGAAA